MNEIVFGHKLHFISHIHRNGNGTTPVDDDKHLQTEKFTLTRLSITNDTWIASGFNSYVVKFKDNAQPYNSAAALELLQKKFALQNIFYFTLRHTIKIEIVDDGAYGCFIDHTPGNLLPYAIDKDPLTALWRGIDNYQESHR